MYVCYIQYVFKGSHKFLGILYERLVNAVSAFLGMLIHAVFKLNHSVIKFPFSVCTFPTQVVCDDFLAPPLS